MANKKINVLIDNKDIETNIRRVKKKEVKQLIVKLAQKADEIVKLLDNKDIVSLLPNIMAANFDFISQDFIEPFVELKPEQIDEMDIVDIFNLAKELLNYNNISIEKIINFLKPDTATANKIVQKLNFGGVDAPLLK